jgi:DNA-binding PadR family transcriptional regulator
MGEALTPTSYAILGLLSLRPWTTYELAQQMDRALGQFWPRAASKLYEEPKKLVRLGLAKATDEAVGRRPRTVYAITAKGRRALRSWVPEPSTGPSLELEALVHVFFAEHGSKDDLLSTIRGVGRWAADQVASSEGISQGYLEGEGPFPERLPWLVLCGAFLSTYIEAMSDWAAWAESVVEDWPDDLRDAPVDWSTLQRMADQLPVLPARNGEQGRAP